MNLQDYDCKYVYLITNNAYCIIRKLQSMVPTRSLTHAQSNFTKQHSTETLYNKLVSA